MKNQYWILGDWNKIKEEEQLKINILENTKAGDQYERFSDIAKDYVYLRFKIGKRTIVIEYNTTTEETLLLTPLEEALYQDILSPEISDLFLDFISSQAKTLGYWPLREINFPES